MSYKIEEVNSCTKKLIFNFENVDLSSQIKAALDEKRKKVNLKGFRKGKAPASMVEKLYGDQVQQDALGRFVADAFYKAIEEEKLNAVGYPRFGKTDYKDDKVTFEATVEIFPEVTIKDFKSLTFTKEDETVTKEDIQKYKEQILASRATIAEVKDKEATLAMGNFATFNFEGEKADGEKPENMKANDYTLEIGSGQFIKGFEEQMIGMKAGETKEISVTFPSDYHEEALRDAPVKFKVELLEMKEKILPDLTDELVKEFGHESVEDFNTKSEKLLTSQKKRTVARKLNEDILNKLVEENQFDIPMALVAQQRNHVIEDMGRNLKNQGFNDEMVKEYVEKWNKDIIGKAEHQVRTGLILNKLAKEYNIEVSDEDLTAKYQEIADENDMKMEEVKDMYEKNKTSVTNLRYALQEEKTFAKIIEQVTIK